MPDLEAKRDTTFELIRNIIEDEGLTGQKLTAREILDIMRENGIDISSSHKVATVLGSHSSHPDLEITESNPYQYEFN